MARSFNGSSDFASIAVNLSSFNQATISFWFWENAFGSGDQLAGEYSTNYNSNSGAFMIDPNDGTIGGFTFNWNSSGGAKLNAKISQPSAQVWHHYVLQLDGTQTGNASVPAIYLDGVSQSITYSGSAIAASLGNYNLYLMSRAGASLFNNGRMADFAIWAGVLLTAGEALALAKGARPSRIRPVSLRVFLPLDGLQSPEPDLSGFKNNAALTGTAFAAGPAVSLFTPRHVRFLDAVAASATFSRTRSLIGTRTGSRQAAL